jgi:serine/threonine protein kinase
MDLLSERLANHHTRSPSQVFRDFIPGKKLGQGKYGVCKEALRVSDGANVAIKIIDKGLLKLEDVQMMENEIRVLEVVSRGHPNVITLHDHFSVGNECTVVFSRPQTEKGLTRHSIPCYGFMYRW